MVLDRGLTPFYYQLKNILKPRILSNDLKGNVHSPTETELCIECKVSRVTIRQALSELMKNGLIYRGRGKGTFITEGVELKQPELSGTIDNLIDAEKGTRIKILSCQENFPPQALQESFSSKEEKLFQLDFRTLTGGKSVSIVMVEEGRW